MNNCKTIAVILVLSMLLALSVSFFGCTPEPNTPSDDPLTVTYKEISKSEYWNKTLGGLLGQFAGFLSGYEFVWRGSDPYVGMPESWFEFLNGPYAGNFEHYAPGDAYRYDRLRVNPETGRNEVYSDDDYHLDIFNQLIIDQYGTSSYAIKEAWKKYKVSDWGGGNDAMLLINSDDMLSPYTGTIEGGNRYGWCTESYIENETLGMNAPGMPTLTISLTDTFASNVGYYDSVVWAKFYATMYSLAYFETDIVTVMEKASKVLPEGSHPKQFYDMAFECYKKYPNNYKSAAEKIHESRISLYRIDNVQTDPNVNGAFAVLSWLYGNNSYLDTCKYASIMGYDGDCTAAITQGVMGILKGFKEGNEEYEALNSTIYYDGEGIYYNDDGSMYEGPIYQARIDGKDYPTRQKISDIVDLYQKNFEKLLVENGGEIKDDVYVIPTTDVPNDTSILFDNYDAETRTTKGFTANNGKLKAYLESQNGNSHSGYSCFQLTNSSEGEAYHTFTNLQKGRTYRLSLYVKTDSGAQVLLFARDQKGNNLQEITFSSNTLINKTLTFTASDTTMQVGVKFDNKAKSGDVVFFDDFMLERVDRLKYTTESTSDLKLSNGSFAKTVKRPDDVKIGEQVILCIKYRNYSGSTTVKVTRNGKLFGGVVASNTSVSSTNGYSYLEIPYVFEKDSDVIKLSFDGKMYFADYAICQSVPYMFR